MYKPPESFENITRRKRDRIFLYASIICGICGLVPPVDILDRMGTWGNCVSRLAEFFPMIVSYSNASTFPQVTKLTLLSALILVPVCVVHFVRYHRLIFNLKDFYRSDFIKYFGWLSGFAVMIPFVAATGGSPSPRTAAIDFLITHSRIALSVFSAAICIFLSAMISATIFWVVALFKPKK